MRKNTLNDFHDQVDRSAGTDGCWPWTGTCSAKGYGRFRMDMVDYVAHRLAHEVANGKIPAGILVCHKCDNPPCCNPAHLFPGTAQDNRADCVAKGRQARGDKSGRHTHPETNPVGERNGEHKLTEREVSEIRKLSAMGSSYETLRRQFKVSKSAIAKAVTRRTWQHAA